jgi:HD-GYP domain-containing protein (c-di-GMP phosphodiesterase class II)/putative methionine-R-sulfoxide reductase with GAF domain
VAIVFVLGLAALVDALYTLQVSRLPYVWICLALLTIASDSVTAIKIPGLTAHVSPSEIFLFLIVLLFGGAPAVVTMAVGGLAFSLKQELLKKREKNYEHAAFDLAEPALSMWVAWRVYAWSGRMDPLWVHGASIAQVALPALAMTAAYFVMNGGLNAVAEAGASGKSPFPLWWKYLKDVSVNYFSNASIAVVLAVNLSSGDIGDALKVVAVIAPLVITPYFSLSLSTGRLKDQEEHLHQMKDLADTLAARLAETLGMQAEAKDRSTSRGHIRRVMKFAVRLADRMGITGAEEQRAIGFAGLLHDYGKTGIPEHILNKPGKLSVDEYEIVKTHASVGADLVSRIPFNLPLAPIIRHHHENWDGTGYPSRLRGDGIPVGARILSVVDCYDALRDHRPYRRGLSHEDAMAIVRERVGTMYDPDVVRAFESMQDDVRREPYDETSVEVAGASTTTADKVAPGEEGVQPLPIELRLSDTAVLLDLHRRLATLGPGADIDATCSMVSRQLLRLAPAGLVVFYRRDEAADELVAVYASGFGEALVRDLRMPLGHKVSGWAATTGRSVINADSALDLDDRLDGIEPRFKSLLSIPLIDAGTAIGVVTLYALRSQAFREEQRQAIELVSGAVAGAFARAVRFEQSQTAAAPAGGATGPSSGSALDALLAMDKGAARDTGRTRAVLCLKNDGAPDVMLHATMAVSRATRIADLIFRATDDSLVVLMRDADPAAGQLIIQRIAAVLPESIAPPPSQESPLRVGFACSPYDGEYWSDLLTVAEQRLSQVPPAERDAATPAAAGALGGQP